MIDRFDQKEAEKAMESLKHIYKIKYLYKCIYV